MNGVRDMGGMHGFGPIAPEIDERAFHETWECRMLGMRRAMTSPSGFLID
jgi:nitrile hydratase subunit beta